MTSAVSASCWASSVAKQSPITLAALWDAITTDIFGVAVRTHRFDGKRGLYGRPNDRFCAWKKLSKVSNT